VVSVVLVGVFRWLDPPGSSVILQERLAMGTKSPVHHSWVSFPEISPEFALAVVAAEDQKFPQHNGFDFGAIRDAFTSNLRGGRLRGGSTISQQVAKNLFLWNGRSYLRKGVEAWFTLLLETLWPKQRILEIYMNIAQFGPGVFGVAAASELYFKRSAAKLTREQSALLAAALPAPSRYRVTAPSAYMRKRQHWILRQMQALGGTGYLHQLTANRRFPSASLVTG
jgi:monofunctional biosynthetic peptidoglycan transglycosylase